MTHYDVDYSKIEDPKAKRDKAIADIIDYLGQEKFDEVHPQFVALRQLNGEEFTVKQLGFYLLMAGVQGYPVTAWHEKIVEDSKL